MPHSAKRKSTIARATLPGVRVLRRDGRFNIQRDGMQGLRLDDLYHSLLSMGWRRFFAMVVAAYLALNTFFAVIYTALGPDAFAGMEVGERAIPFFLESFFFSVQTLATIGYGHTSPISIAANLVVTVEALVGLVCFGILTGILFSRFAKPTSRVVFSRTALIHDHEGVPSFLFRIANARLNQIVEARISVVLIRNERTKEGTTFRRIHDLKLMRSNSPLFYLTWTVIHPIDSNSPLHGWTPDRMREDNTEIMVSLSGMDETFSQTINARISYTSEEILKGHRFKDMVERGPDGMVHIDLSQIHEVQTAG